MKDKIDFTFKLSPAMQKIADELPAKARRIDCVDYSTDRFMLSQDSDCSAVKPNTTNNENKTMTALQQVEAKVRTLIEARDDVDSPNHGGINGFIKLIDEVRKFYVENGIKLDCGLKLNDYVVACFLDYADDLGSNLNIAPAEYAFESEDVLGGIGEMVLSGSLINELNQKLCVYQHLMFLQANKRLVLNLGDQKNPIGLAKD